MCSSWWKIVLKLDENICLEGVQYKPSLKSDLTVLSWLPFYLSYLWCDGLEWRCRFSPWPVHLSKLICQGARFGGEMVMICHVFRYLIQSFLVFHCKKSLYSNPVAKPLGLIVSLMVHLLNGILVFKKNPMTESFVFNQIWDLLFFGNSWMIQGLDLEGVYVSDLQGIRCLSVCVQNTWFKCRDSLMRPKIRKCSCVFVAYSSREVYCGTISLWCSQRIIAYVVEERCHT